MLARSTVLAVSLQLVLALALAVCCPLERDARADAPEVPATAAEGAFRLLASPVRTEREAAVRTLVSLLPGVREQVIAALPGAVWSVQLHLLEVLGQDDSEPALRALLAHFIRTDSTQAVLIRTALVRNEQTATRLLATYRAGPRAFFKNAAAAPRAAARLANLVKLLRRAEIEQLLLTRKSKSGSTGYYKGQYESLKDPARGPGYRRLALQIVTGIALDEALAMPGVYTTGLYRFLRPHHVDAWELRGMAINAVSELCTAADEVTVRRLEDQLQTLQDKRDELFWNLGDLFADSWSVDSKPFQEALFDWDDSIGEYADQLACLYVILPERYDELVRGFKLELEGYHYPKVPLRRWGYISALLIRVGWYSEAIRAYEQSMYLMESFALGYYNQACAYASWSLMEELTEEEREDKRRRALSCLARSVEAGWRDVAWMNEDRDLDAIRDTTIYRLLVEKIDRELALPEDD